MLGHNTQQQMHAILSTACMDTQQADAHRRDVVSRALSYTRAAMATAVQCDESADVLQQVGACCSCGRHGRRPQLLLHTLHDIYERIRRDGSLVHDGGSDGLRVGSNACCPSLAIARHLNEPTEAMSSIA
jgi:hypothetical protein